MSSKYQLLARYLEQSDQDMLRMTFDEVEQQIRGELPAAALEHRAWWANSETHAHARHGWLSVGYETSSVDMEGRELVFLRAPQMKTEIRLAEMAAPAPKRTPAPRPSRPHQRGDSRLGSIVRAAGGVENLSRIMEAVQDYIEGDLLETELGRILRKLWPRR